MSNPFRLIAPEVLYADTVAKAAAYESLSQRYAAHGDAFVALHAAWAADMNTVQSVMWEHVMVAAPLADEALAAITDGVGQALLHYAATAEPVADVREALLAARAGALLTFEDAASNAITGRLISLDHLAGMALPDEDEGNRVARIRTGEYSAPELGLIRRQAAYDGIMAARERYQAGDIDGTLDAAWHADWAALEAYLLEAAAGAGDSALVTVDLRWELVADAVYAVKSVPADVAVAVQTVRDAMIGALGPIEGPRLAGRFLTVDGVI